MIEGNDHDWGHLPARDGQARGLVELVRYLSRRAFAGRIRDFACRAVPFAFSRRSEARAGSMPQPTTPIAA
jgi:hypothetical protein